MAWIAPVIAGASAVYNAYSQNKRNKQQIDLSNTAVERRMQDMRNAGINPSLAFMNASGGAQTPNLESVEFNPDVSTEVQNAYSAASTRSLQRLQMANLSEQNSLLAAQTNGAEAASRKANAEAQEIEARIPYSAADSQNRSLLLDHELQRIAAEISSASSRADIDWNEREFQRLTFDQRLEISKLQKEYQQLVNRAAALGIPQKEIDAEFAKQHGMDQKKLELLRMGAETVSEFIPNPSKLFKR